jgi:hypothetical protein
VTFANAERERSDISRHPNFARRARNIDGCITSHLTMRSVPMWSLVLIVALRGSSVAVLPPDSASPAAVLDAYLTALMASDCQTARALVTSTFTVGNGELCGAVRVSAYVVDPTPATPPDGEVIFATTLTTSGDGASIPAGDVTWFYDLIRQPSGAWRIVGGGSGP